MVTTESDTARLDALEQRQRRLIFQVRVLIVIAIMLTGFTYYQHYQEKWLIEHNQRLVDMIKLMQPVGGPPRL